MIEDKPNKLDTLIKCLPDAPYKAALVSEIESLRAERDAAVADALNAVLGEHLDGFTVEGKVRHHDDVIYDRAIEDAADAIRQLIYRAAIKGKAP